MDNGAYGQTDDAGSASLRQNGGGVQIDTKEERVMRYLVTALLALGLTITAMAPVTFAQVNVPLNSPSTNQYGTLIVPTVCPVIGPCYEPR